MYMGVSFLCFYQSYLWLNCENFFFLPIQPHSYKMHVWWQTFWNGGTFFFLRACVLFYFIYFFVCFLGSPSAKQSGAAQGARSPAPKVHSGSFLSSGVKVREGKMGMWILKQEIIRKGDKNGILQLYFHFVILSVWIYKPWPCEPVKSKSPGFCDLFHN